MNDASNFFDGWTFPAFERVLKDIPHGLALEILATFKSELVQMFEAMKSDGMWGYWEGQPHDPEQPTETAPHLWWLAQADTTLWDIEFPIRIHLTPEMFTEAFKRDLSEHARLDGDIRDDGIEVEERARLLASLNEWRAAIDAAEQALRDYP